MQATFGETVSSSTQTSCSRQAMAFWHGPSLQPTHLSHSTDCAEYVSARMVCLFYSNLVLPNSPAATNISPCFSALRVSVCLYLGTYLSIDVYTFHLICNNTINVFFDHCLINERYTRKLVQHLQLPLKETSRSDCLSVLQIANHKCKDGQESDENLM